jgi:hypothetical protein
LRGGAVSGIPGHNAAMKVLDVAKKAPNTQHRMSNVEVRA